MWPSFWACSLFEEADMITIFNRAEVCVTYDLNVCAAVREALSAAGIPYVVRTQNLYGSRGHTGAAGIDPASAYEYRIFVRRGDLDAAQFALR